MQFHFGKYVLDTDMGRLTGPEGDIVLRRQAWRLLVELVEQAPALVERDDLLDRVWGRSAVSPNTLPQTISELRQALGDQVRQPDYIETCHGRGYRMACPVERRAADRSEAGSEKGENGAEVGFSRQWRRWPMAVAMVGLFALVAALGWHGFDSEAPVPASQSANPIMTETLLRQAEVASARHDPRAAASSWRALALIEPDNLDWALAQAEAELDALQGEHARRSLALLATNPALRQHPHLLILRARLAEIDGEFDQALQLARAAAVQAHSLDLPEFYSQAARMKARAWKRQGELDRAAAAIQAVLEERDVVLDLNARFDLTLELAVLRREQGRLREARATLEQARNWQVSGVSDPRLMIQEALILAAEGQAPKAWESLQSMAVSVTEDLAPDTHLAWHSALGQVAMEMGEIDQGLTAFEQGFSLARTTGAAYQAAGLKINAGSLLARHDRFEEAEHLWRGALDVFERIGDRRGEAIALGNLAAAASAQGHNAQSGALNQRALALFRELQLDGPRARTAFNLALVASREGRLEDAEALFEEAQTGFQNAGVVDQMLYVGASRVDFRVLAGDLLLAESLLEGLEEVEGGSMLARAAVLASRGRLEKWRGRLKLSRLAFEAALVKRQNSGHDGWQATSELELLQLALLEGGDHWQIRVQALELADNFRMTSQSRAAARAELVAAEALLAQGDALAARRELEQIRRSQHEHAFVDTSLALDLYWLEAWAGREEERIPRLSALAQRAIEGGFLGKLAQIEAGLAVRGLSFEDLEGIAGIDLPRQAIDDASLVVVLPPYLSSIAGVTASR